MTEDRDEIIGYIKEVSSKVRRNSRDEVFYLRLGIINLSRWKAPFWVRLMARLQRSLVLDIFAFGPTNIFVWFLYRLPQSAASSVANLGRSFQMATHPRTDSVCRALWKKAMSGPIHFPTGTRWRRARVVARAGTGRLHAVLLCATVVHMIYEIEKKAFLLGVAVEIPDTDAGHWSLSGGLPVSHQLDWVALLSTCSAYWIQC